MQRTTIPLLGARQVVLFICIYLLAFGLYNRPVVVLAHSSQICEADVIFGFFTCKLENRVRHQGECQGSVEMHMENWLFLDISPAFGEMELGRSQQTG